MNKKLGYHKIISFNFLALGLSMVWSLNIIFMPLLVTRQLSVSAFKIGFLVSLASLASLLFSPLSGHFSDRLVTPLGRRHPVIIAGTVLAVIFLVILPGLRVYAQIAILAFFLFIVVASMETSFYALIPEIIPKSQLGLGVSILTILRYSGSALMVILGSLSWKINHAYPFYIAAVFILITSLVTLFEAGRHLSFEIKREMKGMSLKERWRDLRAKRDIINFYLAQFFWSFALASIFPFLFIYLKARYGVEIGEIYKWVPGLALIGFLTVLFAGLSTDRWGYKKTLTLGVTLLAIIMPLNLIKGGPPQSIFFLGLIMIPVVIILSQAPAYLSHLIPAGREGEFFGYDNFSITLAHIPGAWLSGLMIDRFGYPAMFCLSSAAGLVSLVFALRNFLRG